MKWGTRGLGARAGTRSIVAMLYGASAVAWGCSPDGMVTTRCATPSDPICASTADCPSGTVCRDPLRVGTGATCAGPCTSDASGCRCVVARPEPTDVTTRALVDGFAVPVASLEAHVDAPGTFDLGMPPEVKLVACALFRCAPEVVCAPTRAIANYGACAVAETLVEPPRVIGLGDLHHLPGSDAADACGSTVRPLATGLWFGCWGYDDARVSTATPLRPIGASDVPTWLADAVPLDHCATDTQDEACRLGDGFGICIGTDCVPTCAASDDCSAGTGCQHITEAHAGGCVAGGG